MSRLLLTPLLSLLLLFFLSLASSIEARHTKHVLNLDVSTYDKIVNTGTPESRNNKLLKKQIFLIKLDVEFPHGAEHDAFDRFAEILGNMSTMEALQLVAPRDSIVHSRLFKRRSKEEKGKSGEEDEEELRAPSISDLQRAGHSAHPLLARMPRRRRPLPGGVVVTASSDYGSGGGGDSCAASSTTHSACEDEEEVRMEKTSSQFVSRVPIVAEIRTKEAGKSPNVELVERVFGFTESQLPRIVLLPPFRPTRLSLAQDVARIRDEATAKKKRKKTLKKLAALVGKSKKQKQEEAQQQQQDLEEQAQKQKGGKDEEGITVMERFASHFSGAFPNATTTDGLFRFLLDEFRVWGTREEGNLADVLPFVPPMRGFRNATLADRVVRWIADLGAVLASIAEEQTAQTKEPESEEDEKEHRMLLPLLQNLNETLGETQTETKTTKKKKKKKKSVRKDEEDHSTVLRTLYRALTTEKGEAEEENGKEKDQGVVVGDATSTTTPPLPDSAPPLLKCLCKLQSVYDRKVQLSHTRMASNSARVLEVQLNALSLSLALLSDGMKK